VKISRENNKDTVDKIHCFSAEKDQTHTVNDETRELIYLLKNQANKQTKTQNCNLIFDGYCFCAVIHY
jgi:hypothetical protein